MIASYRNFFQLLLGFSLVAAFTFCPGPLPAEQAPNSLEATYDWHREGPLEFLGFLKELATAGKPTFVLSDVPDNWVTAAHIPQLMKVIDSDEPCANVCSIYSSYYDRRLSTVGHEAAFMIEGFRRGTYPPELNSGKADVNIKGLKQWWDNFQE